MATRSIPKGVTMLLLVAVVSSGCATASQKYVAFATRGQPPDLQMLDRAQCEDIAQMHKGSDADAALAMGALGGVVGGASGAAWGAILGAVGHGLSAGSGSLAGLAVGAGVGLTVGIIQGIQANRARYERIFIACVRARGYEVGG